MNSWHSWSSNSRWLVFSSKQNGPYTQLWLTHIDEEGNDTPPVVLERFTTADRAANIPEFVKLPGDAIAEIREQFLDPYSFLRAGTANQRTGDQVGAERSFRRGLELAPDERLFRARVSERIRTGVGDETFERWREQGMSESWNLVRELVGESAASPEITSAGVALTRRERDVLDLLAPGYTSREIAASAFTLIYTVKHLDPPEEAHPPRQDVREPDAV